MALYFQYVLKHINAQVKKMDHLIVYIPSCYSIRDATYDKLELLLSLSTFF